MKLNNKAYIVQNEDGKYIVQAGFECGGRKPEVEGDSVEDAKELFIEKVQKYGMTEEGFRWVNQPSADVID